MTQARSIITRSKETLANVSWKRFQQAYDVGPVIGNGSFSSVCKVVQRSTGVVHAGKFTSQHEAEKEISVMRQLRNCQTSHLLVYHDVIADESGRYTCLVSDLMKGRDLQSALEERGSYTEDDARAILRQILEALKNMHESGIVHRDLKLENVLLPSAENNTTIKIADFGLAASWINSEPKMRKRCGTPAFVAPEVLPQDCEYDSKVDVWSAGVILYMLLSGCPPFWGKDIPHLLASIMEQDLCFKDPAWELVTPAAKDLLQSMMTKDPSSRLSAAEALDHPWMLHA